MPLRLNSEDLAFRRVGDEYFVLTVADNTLHRITGAGVRIMELLEEGKDEEEIVRSLAEEYDAGEAELAADLGAFLAELAAKGIVVARDGG